MIKNENFKAFTLIELVVVITILLILNGIGVYVYLNTLKEARNATRVSDMTNIQVRLKTHKVKYSQYPTPGSLPVTISDNGTDIIKQGKFSNGTLGVQTTEIINKPYDPLFKIPYTYSITNNGLFFQIAMSLEVDNDEELNNIYGLKAFVKGDYQQIRQNVPSIVFVQPFEDFSFLEEGFIVHNGSYNLPYINSNTLPQIRTLDINEIINENNIDIPVFHGYNNCEEIKDSGRSLGNGFYFLASGITECTF